MTEPEPEYQSRTPFTRREKIWIFVGLAVIVVSLISMAIG